MDADILKEYLGHYFNRDLMSAGLSANDYNSIIEEDIPVTYAAILDTVEPWIL